MPICHPYNGQCPIQNLLKHVNNPHVLLPAIMTSLAVICALKPGVYHSFGSGVSDLFQAIGEGLDDTFMYGFTHYINLGAYS